MADLVVQDGQTFLTIGDSITDAGRRAAAAPYGTGYVSIFIDLVKISTTSIRASAATASPAFTTAGPMTSSAISPTGSRS